MFNQHVIDWLSSQARELDAHVNSMRNKTNCAARSMCFRSQQAVARMIAEIVAQVTYKE